MTKNQSARPPRTGMAKLNRGKEKLNRIAPKITTPAKMPPEKRKKSIIEITVLSISLSSSKFLYNLFVSHTSHSINQPIQRK